MNYLTAQEALQISKEARQNLLHQVELDVDDLVLYCLDIINSEARIGKQTCVVEVPETHRFLSKGIPIRYLTALVRFTKERLRSINYVVRHDKWDRGYLIFIYWNSSKDSIVKRIKRRPPPTKIPTR